jgi:bifunctional UDP-N-acetylglucosamine pyrophosphorylase / glucosamine-1-phosphate N-acetyltransferase
MTRILIVPAAGAGTRLGGVLPKLLVPVGGRAMIDRVLDLYRRVARSAVVVVSPAAEPSARTHLRVTETEAYLAGVAIAIECVVQPAPTGMLDAILLAAPAVSQAQPDEVWVTWCDQIAVHPDTVRRLAAALRDNPAAALAMPTVRRSDPYTHLERDATGRITRILHRREGDAMPQVGESDMGLFAMPRRTYEELLPAYERHVSVGKATGERNFVPFVPWLAGAHTVVTFPAVDEIEAMGVNTPDELRAVEAYLRDRERA